MVLLDVKPWCQGDFLDIKTCACHQDLPWSRPTSAIFDFKILHRLHQANKKDDKTNIGFFE